MSTYSVKNIYAPTPNTERGKTTRLTSTPNGEDIVYASGSSIVIRSARNPLKCDIYTGHKAKTTVARFAPSGYYCASADIQGNVMVWDTVNPEHVVKYQKRSFAGGVFDLAWTEDSKRICCVGSGKEQKAEVFMWDAGSSAGDLSGHVQNVLGCAVRPKRPYRIATCGEDSLMNFYQGPPFKFVHSNRVHQRFVNTVEYSPNGDFIVTGGGDKKIFMYDGQDGKVLGEFTADVDNKNQLLGGAHKLSVLSLAFTRDGNNLFSASTDKTVKLWDVATRKYLRTFYVREASDPKGIDLYDTPMGITYTNYGAIACTLRGDLCTFDQRVDGPLPVSIMRGHNKQVVSLHVLPTASTESEDKLNRVDFITAGMDGQIIEYNIARGQRSGVPGYYHDAQPAAGAIESQGVILSLGHNNTLALTESPKDSAYSPILKPVPPATAAAGELPAVDAAPFTTVPTPALGKTTINQPKGTAYLCNGAQTAVISDRLIQIFEFKPSASPAPVAELALGYNPLCIATNSEQNIILLGGSDQLVHFYKYDGKAITETGTSKSKYSAPVCAVAISPDGKLFAAARDRYLCVGPVENCGEGKLQENRLLHLGKISTLDFSPDSTRILSGALNCQMFIWDAADPDKVETYVSVHAPQGVSQAKWVTPDSFLTAGPDGTVRFWSK